MLYTILILILFFVSVALHVLWCRSSKSDELRIVSFGVISVALFGVYVFFVSSQPSGKELNVPVSCGVLYILLIPVYLIFYFGMNVESPSRRILVLAEEKKGISHSEILRSITNDDLIIPRLKDLQEASYVQIKDGRYRLTRPGVRTAKFLDIYQKLNGRVQGG